MPSLAHTHPALADQWVTTDDGKTPHDVTAGSAYRATWQCATCNHIWTAVTYSRTRGTGCPECKKGVLSAQRSTPKPGRSLAEKHPHIAAEWDPDRNDLAPTQVAAHARLLAHWTCSTCEHKWVAQVANRTRPATRGNGCPACFGTRHSAHMRLAVGGSWLAEASPQIAAEWDYDSKLNQGDSPATVKARSGIKRAWICSCGHAWVATPANRARGYGCTPCGRGRGSQQEVATLEGLKSLDPSACSQRIPRTDGRQSRAWSVDACSEAFSLIVEFDGSYWHSTSANPSAPRRDAEKSEDLRTQGWTVARIRESPLEPTHHDDLVVPYGCAGEDLTQRVAAHARALLQQRIAVS